MTEIVEILSLYQLKQERIFWCQNQTIMQPNIFRQFISNRSEKKTDSHN